MTIRKTGAVTGQVLGVEGHPDGEPELLPADAREPEDALVDRPLQGTRPLRPAPDEDDD